MAMLCVLLALSVPTLYAQSRTIPIEHITEEQGLSSSVVNTILQDRSGMLWFGTVNGLNRYDGLTFQYFQNLHHSLPDSVAEGTDAVQKIIQDYTGSLWLLTRSQHGVSLFNPSSQRFEFVQSPEQPVFFFALTEDANKALWFGASRGLFRLNRAAMRLEPVFLPNNALRNERIHAIQEDARERLWIATNTSIYALDRERRQLFSLDAPLPTDAHITTLLVVSDSSKTLLWIGTEKHGLYCIDADTRQILDVYTTERGLTSNKIHSLLLSRARKIWVGTNKGITVLSSFAPFLSSTAPSLTSTTSPMRLQNDPANPFSLSGNIIQALYEDASGVVWAAAEFYGLNKYAPLRHKFQFLTSSFIPGQKTLTSKYVRGIAETPTNNAQGTFLWIATQTGGLNRLNRTTGEWAYFRQDKLGSDTAWALRFDGKQTLWIGLVHGGLWSYNTQTQVFTRFSGIPADASVQLIFLDKQGTVWCAGDNLPLTAVSPDKQTRSYRVNPTSNSEERVFTCLEDRRGRFLLGTEKGLRELDRQTGSVNVLVAKVAVNILFEDSTEAIWIGTRGQGLWQYRRKSASTLEYIYKIDEKEGLPSNIVSGILPNFASRTLWVSTKRGLAEIDTERRKVIRVYDTDDGLQGNEFHRESAFVSERGEMFFGGTNGVNYFHPARMLHNDLPPPIVITSVRKSEREEITLDSSMQASQTISVRHDENTLTFRFVALDFNSPERNVYAYKLEGFDKGWIQSGNRREATYTSLEPGEYVFSVRAANNDGVWNENGATMRVVIAPPVWRTWWFIGLSLASVICIGFVAYRARIRGIEARNAWLEKQVTTRTAELRSANVELQQINNKLSDSLNEIQILSSVLDGERNKSEDLLLNILPPSIAERLKWGETTIVDTFESATVLFSDMVGFTKIAARVSPEELIVMLNRMFSVFDQLAEIHGVEKIKTIGDAYMAVAGVPIPNEQHAAAIAAMALDMQQAIRELAETENLPISIRVGMHSGYLTAGVIGEKKFAYDLWGDTVNTASRMESSGEAGRVQCSEAAYQLLKDTFDFEERGTIEVKGKGAMKTYFLLGQKH
jgi:ligand-binding sensor domain-containing protein/class 3 adenylate cyclase